MASAQEQIVEVQSREGVGKNAARRLRKGGQVPGSVYGLGRDPFSVTVQARRVDEVLHLESGQNTILTLKMAGSDQRREVMIRELQRDPVTNRVIHVDFVRVDPNKTLTVKVPVRLLGTPEGVKNEGGILDFVHREVELSCLPSAIPEHLDIDVSGLHLNQHVSVSDVPTAEGVEILDDPHTIIAVVSLARAEVVAEPTEEEAAAAAAEAEGDKDKEEAEESGDKD